MTPWPEFRLVNPVLVPSVVLDPSRFLDRELSVRTDLRYYSVGKTYMIFTGKRVVVTGASLGLGKKYRGRRFLREGATVLICARNADQIRRGLYGAGSDLTWTCFFLRL